MPKIKKGKIITLTSMKGGVGKTFTTLLLASIYDKLNKKVLVIDLDLYAGSIAFLLNIDPKSSVYNICDDMNNNRYQGINSSDYLFKYNDNIDILPAPKDPRQANKIDRKCLELLLTNISSYYDIVLIDTNHILDMHSMVAFDVSDKIVDVFTNDAIDLKNTKNFVSICANASVDNVVLLLNKATDYRKNYFSDYDIKNLIKHDIDYTIPYTFYLKEFDSYIIEGELYKMFSTAITKKNYKIIEKLALELIEFDGNGVRENEEK